MLKQFYPKHYYVSAYQIPFDKLYKKGYRGIIFDIDNTLVPHGEPADNRSRNLIKELKSLGYQIVFLSNNKEPRVKPFADAVGQPYIHDGHKPSVKNYMNAMKLMKTNRENTLFVGDQLFTDVWGANRSGIETILVRPMNKKEEIQIVLKRYPEKLVLFFYRRKCRKEGRIYLNGQV